MQNYRAIKKKPVGGGGSSLLENQKANSVVTDNTRSISSNDTRQHARSNAASRSDRSLNNSGMSDRRVESNGSWNSHPGSSSDRRAVSNGSMSAAGADHDRRRPRRGNSSQDPQRQIQRGHPVDIQEPEPTPATSQYDLIWHQGDLALQFSLNAKHQIAIRHIETNQPKETTAGLASAALGDVLIALNWEDVSALTPSEVQRRLNRAELPMTLTFQSFSQQPAISRLKRAPSMSRMPPLQPNEFEAVWTSGRLGVVIACDSAGRPVVREYAKEASTDPGVAAIQPLDELIFVNDIAVGEISYNDAISALRLAQKPVLLRFRREVVAPKQEQPPAVAPSRNPSQPRPGSGKSHRRRVPPEAQEKDKYTVVWRDGPLGLVLKKNDVNDIYVKEIKKKGLALLHEAIMSEGDVLVSITGVPAKPLGLTGTVDFLKSVQKPVELVFQHVTSHPSQHVVPVSRGERCRESTVVVLPLPTDPVSNESFISDGVAAKYLPPKTAAQASAPAIDTYDLIWHRGKLAISLRYASSNRTVIRKITPGEQQTTANLDAASVGDVLIAINWDDVTSSPYDNVVTRLKERDFPLTLTFKRQPPTTSTGAAATQTASKQSRGEYEVMWRDGKLGVRVHCDPEGRAVVRERTEAATDPELAQIQAGDELIFVNDLRVRTIGYSEALVVMKQPKPIKLRFRRRRQRSSSAAASQLHATVVEPAEVHLDAALPPDSPRQSLAMAASASIDSEDKMYSVDWAGGSLGITLRMNDQFEIFIAQLTGKGLSLERPELGVGDILIGVMGVPTTPLGLAGTVDFLKCIQKPAVLTFLRKARPHGSSINPPALPEPTRSQHIDFSADQVVEAVHVEESCASRLTKVVDSGVEVCQAPATVPLVDTSVAAEHVPPVPPPFPTDLTNAVDAPTWSFARDSSLARGSMPMSPSNQLTVSLRASSGPGVTVLSPSRSPTVHHKASGTPPGTPPLTFEFPSASAPSELVLSPVENVSFGPSTSATPPTCASPIATSVIVSRAPLSSATSSSPTLHPITSTLVFSPAHAASIVISRPMPTHVVPPPHSVSSGPVESPVETHGHPSTPPLQATAAPSTPKVACVPAWSLEPTTPPGTPPTTSMLEPFFKYTEPPPVSAAQASRPPVTSPTSVPVSTKIAPATPPGTPPSVSMMEPYYSYVDPIAGPSKTSVEASVQPTTPPESPPFESFGPTSSPPNLDLSVGIADLPDLRPPSADQTFTIQQEDVAPVFVESASPLHDGLHTEFPTHQRPESFTCIDMSLQHGEVIEEDGGGFTADDSSPLELPTPPTASGLFSPSVEWDISRENRTPTHQTPTAASSMVPLYDTALSKSQSAESLDSLDLSDYQSSSESLSSSTEFLSNRSMTPDFLPNQVTMSVVDPQPPVSSMDTVSLDDGEVDIDEEDDDDDSIQEDYSTIAPEDVPILSMSSRSMSSRSMSSVSMPPTPPPIAMSTPFSDSAPDDASISEPKTLYSILWRGGPLGLAIKRNKQDEICVKALTGGGLAGKSDIIQPGDVLVQCGTTIVQYSTLAETSRVLKQAKTPVSLVFLRREQQARNSVASSASVPTLDMSTNSYDNALGGGLNSSVSDGFLPVDPSTPQRGSVYMPKRFKSSSKHSTVYSIVWEGGPLGIAVTKNSDDENCVMRLTGDGLAAQSSIIRVGDVLMSAGDVQLSNVSLTAAMHVIQLARKPTFLVFRRTGEDEDV
ncbi:hypothetical protein, variant 1 [Aphanomyces invadans]|uniref:PDZ domain-containing protein n=1 Tax=Aphanomyces invadans TaxID=157072 RepID=A0A024TVS6_9STRA|nr:hypothetical protein, variant 1 [Aphanomyces invadans]ETV98138.1 hypothetical protein, variant 1 [Aphanomyces invadans]|eukprot:XP_008873013.1 hypothetical protein, variant 1 [Aphanomyces invadans]